MTTNKTIHGDTRVVKIVKELPNGDFLITFTIDLSAIKSDVYLASCLTNEKYCGINELNHDIAYTESAVDMIYTVTVSDITMRSDFNMIEARVKKSINLSMQDNATLLKDDTSWIRPNKTFHVR